MVLRVVVERNAARYDASSMEVRGGTPLWRSDDDPLDVFSALFWPAWMADAACVEAPDKDAWFPSRGESNEPAKTVCFGCLVKSECLAFALEENISFGIWGGMTTRERRARRNAEAA